MSTINLTTASLSDLKFYCQYNNIAVIGDRRSKQTYLESINNYQEIKKNNLGFDLIDFCYGDYLSDHYNRDNEQLISVDYYIGMTLQDLHNQVIDIIDYVYSDKLEHLSNNNVIQYAIESYFANYTQQDFLNTLQYVDKENYDDNYPTTFYFLLSWDILQVSFQEIKDYATNFNNRYVIRDEKHENLNYKKVETIELGYTLYGDYVNSSVEKSNYECLVESLIERFTKDRLELSNIQYKESLGYGSYSIRIIGNLDRDIWEFIKDMNNDIDNYPLINEDHHSDMVYKDCLQYWNEENYYEIKDTLLNTYDIDLETILDGKLNDSDKLYAYLVELSYFDNIDVTEVNCNSYWIIEDPQIKQINDLIQYDLNH